MMDLNIIWKKYKSEYIVKAIRFYEHMENHEEVQESPTHKGIPVCKLCGKSGEEIYTKGNRL